MTLPRILPGAPKDNAQQRIAISRLADARGLRARHDPCVATDQARSQNILRTTTGGRVVRPRACWVLCFLLAGANVSCNSFFQVETPQDNGLAGDPGNPSGGGPSGGGDEPSPGPGEDPSGGGGSGGGSSGDPPPEDPSVNLDFWSIIDRRCVWCHTSQHPLAGFDFQRPNRTIRPDQYELFVTGVQQEMAPAIQLLPGVEKQLLLDWVRERGATLPPVDIPTRYAWNLNDVIASAPDGGQGPWLGFIVEDAFIDNDAWRVQTFTDRHGRTYRGVALDQRRQVDQSVFSSSRNPSSYLVFKGIPWHGRFYNSRMEGDVRVGRWMSVGMHARDVTPTGRSHRQYVRLQFDRDSICMRSAPTKIETWPWQGEDSHLRGNLCASGFYQTPSEWLHFVFEAKRQSDGVHWTALVTNPATGKVMADLAAIEPLEGALQGTFFLHAYSTGSDRMWANLLFTCEIDTHQ